MNFLRNLLRWSVASSLFGVMFAGTLWLCICRDGWNQADLGSKSRSLGPSISQLERIGELAATRVHVTDIMTAEGQGLRGVWLVGGDALLSCDLSRAKIVQIDAAARTATIRLPDLHVKFARVDHKKTRTWSVERNTWLPWKWGDQGTFRDAALVHAQLLIEEAALSERNLELARSQTVTLIQRMYEVVGWDVAVVWE